MMGMPNTLPEAGMLQHRQTLIVLQGKHAVALRQFAGVNRVSAGSGAADLHAPGTQFVHTHSGSIGSTSSTPL
jgi:hypothetical protein